MWRWALVGLLVALAIAVPASAAPPQACSGTPLDQLRVTRIGCRDARLAATEYLSSYAALNALGGGTVAFTGQHGTWRCQVRQPEPEGSLPRFSCIGADRAHMLFAAAISPLRKCPTFTAWGETIIGALVTRNSSCSELVAFVERFPAYGPEYGGYPAPLASTTVVWSSLLPNGHGPVAIKYRCTYRIPATTPEGWLCTDGYFAFGFQYSPPQHSPEAAR